MRTEAKDALLPSRAGKVTVHGSNANVSHTINEDERAEFTNHINSASATKPKRPVTRRARVSRHNRDCTHFDETVRDLFVQQRRPGREWLSGRHK